MKSPKSKSRSKSKSKPKSKSKLKSKSPTPPTIGFLVAATKAIWSDFISTFESKLKSLGWTKGSNVNIQYQEANGDEGMYESIAANFVAAGVDVIVTAGTEAAVACQTATRGNPISVVFASAGDPLYSGLVTSLTNPTGTNLTGCSNMQTDLGVTGGRVGKLNDRFGPKLVGVIGYPLRPIDKAIDVAVNVLTAAHIPVFTPTYLGYLAPSDFQSVATIQARLQLLAGVDVLYVCSDPLLRSNADNLIKAAHNLHMRTMHEFSQWKTAHHGDDSYGPDFQDLFTHAAVQVDQILNGTPSGMIDVYEPNSFS
jgi:putative ABC transport system substrate-binding protein